MISKMKTNRNDWRTGKLKAKRGSDTDKKETVVVLGHTGPVEVV